LLGSPVKFLNWVYLVDINGFSKTREAEKNNEHRESMTGFKQ